MKALARLRGCAVLPEPLLFAYVISTKISWAGLNKDYLTVLTLLQLKDDFNARHEAEGFNIDQGLQQRFNTETL